MLRCVVATALCRRAGQQSMGNASTQRGGTTRALSRAESSQIFVSGINDPGYNAKARKQRGLRGFPRSPHARLSFMLVR
jgi:hypothetical protein